jgi:hypothetical protein
MVQGVVVRFGWLGHPRLTLAVETGGWCVPVYSDAGVILTACGLIAGEVVHASCTIPSITMAVTTC